MKGKRSLVARSALITVGVVIGALITGSFAVFAHGASATPHGAKMDIQHVVVIFQENVSFDHYFGTYPNAANPAMEPGFAARADTPTVNGLTEALLTDNPNFANPQRLDRSQALTCDQDHGYLDEQKAVDHGLMDQFIQTAGGGCTDKSIVMDYYDGNTVTAMWNYAQQFAMSDNSYSTNYGPSTVGALNLISGQTHGATTPDIPGNVANGTVIGDPRPLAANDDCTIASAPKAAMSGSNIGDLLNAKGVTWGWFQGASRPAAW